MSKSRETRGAASSGGMPWKIVALLVVAVMAFVFFRGQGEARTPGTAFTARRGTLEIIVLEGGSVESMEQQDVISEVKGREGAKIVGIVEEGYMVTEEDVAAAKVLVELDSADLEDKLTNQEIQFQSTEAQYIEAQQAYDIQLNQNESNIRSAELDARFARMDFEKFLGAGPARGILDSLGLDTEVEEVDTAVLMAEMRAAAKERMYAANNRGAPAGRERSFEDLVVDDELRQEIRTAMMAAMAERGMMGGESGGQGDRSQWRMRQGQQGQGGSGERRFTEESIDRLMQLGVDVYAIAEEMGKIRTPAPVEAAKPIEMAVAPSKPRVSIDFSGYADMDLLEDGEAKQALRELEDDLLVGREEFSLAKTQLEGTRRLAERDFVTQTELEVEKVKMNKAEIKVKSAQTAQRLYIRYEFPKKAEEFLSDYEEALMKLERTKKEAYAKLAQAEARLKSAERKYKIERDRVEDLKDQIAKCTIRATRTGLVVYGSSGGDMFRGGGREPIQEGTTVRLRQRIITIPDMTKMAVIVKVHESSAEQVQVGQQARIRIDAHADQVLEGEVTRVAPLPDSQDRWFNPDLKVYSTTVKIARVPDWIKPGMSAEVEILVKRLEEVVHIPLQAIVSSGKDRYCYVVTGGGPELRPVETGEYTDEFIEIRSGLEEGERVYLQPPEPGWENAGDGAAT